ncbi:MAG: hypothetical protein ACPG8W_14110 [Candidatus Promineifilaceae bacterium]
MFSDKEQKQRTLILMAVVVVAIPLFFIDRITHEFRQVYEMSAVYFLPWQTHTHEIGNDLLLSIDHPRGWSVVEEENSWLTVRGKALSDGCFVRFGGISINYDYDGMLVEQGIALEQPLEGLMTALVEAQIYSEEDDTDMRETIDVPVSVDPATSAHALTFGTLVEKRRIPSSDNLVESAVDDAFYPARLRRVWLMKPHNTSIYANASFNDAYCFNKMDVLEQLVHSIKVSD